MGDQDRENGQLDLLGEDYEPCPDCGGTGQKDEVRCSTCEGTGYNELQCTVCNGPCQGH